VFVRLTVVVVVCVSIMSSVAGQAGAEPPPVSCPLRAGPCNVRASHPGSPGSGSPQRTGSNGKARPCYVTVRGERFPCEDPTFGTWNSRDQCFERLASPQPPKSAPVWQSHITGVIIEQTCPRILGVGGGLVWRPALGSGPSITPAELAQRAVRRLGIRGPAIGMEPPPGKHGRVGLPVWLWTRRSPRTWGPASATASVPGLSVTATARGTQIVWRMGDGHQVACHGPGTPYRAAFGGQSSPDCGYVYSEPSTLLPGGVYRVTATTTWRVDWAGGGESGTLTVQRSSSTTTAIGEIQVLIQ
jgi:hypothetical protein